jgi:hypothetical protein
MKSYFKVLFILIITASITSCDKKIYFTSNVRSKVESKNIDLKKLQYFIDNDVLLSREILSDNTSVAAGNVIFKNGKCYETIRLRANTKGICTAVYPNRLYIAFETGDNKNITFSIPKSAGSRDVYQMVNEDMYRNHSSTIKYEGKIYNLIMKHGYLPRLMIRSREYYESETRKERRMKGQSVH